MGTATIPATRPVIVTEHTIIARVCRGVMPIALKMPAVQIGCVFAIDTDAHAPGQLDWLDGGCARAELFGIGPDRVINSRGAAALTRPPS